jgi:DNA-binding IclR family transcriptional regulator
MCFFNLQRSSISSESRLELVSHSTEVVLELFDLVKELVLLSVPRTNVNAWVKKVKLTSRSRCVLATTC